MMSLVGNVFAVRDDVTKALAGNVFAVRDMSQKHWLEMVLGQMLKNIKFWG